MKKKHLKSIIVTALLCLVVLAILLYASKQSSPSSPSQPPLPSSIQGTTTSAPTALLRIFAPRVTVTLPGKIARDGIDGMDIPVDTVIETDGQGRAEIEYPNGTVTRIDHNSRITLSTFEETPSQVDVTLNHGKVWSRVKKLLGKESYSTRTNTVVATVRGTSYGHEILPGGTNKITTTEGDVASECVNETQFADVPEDHKALMDCDGKKNEQSALLSDKDKKDEWFLFNNEQDGGVLGAKTETPEPTGFPFRSISSVIPCIGPDGVHFDATKIDCDNLNNFWNSHPPSSPAGASGDGGSTSSDNGGNGGSTTPTPTPLPDPTIATVTIQHCFSTSCQNTTTIRVDGTNYNADARLNVTLPDSTIWSESTSNNQTPPDATLVGGDDITFIHMDLYNIPLQNFPCQPVDVTVYFKTAGDTRSATTSVIDPLYCQATSLLNVAF